MTTTWTATGYTHHSGALCGVEGLIGFYDEGGTIQRVSDTPEKALRYTQQDIDGFEAERRLTQLKEPVSGVGSDWMALFVKPRALDGVEFDEPGELLFGESNTGESVWLGPPEVLRQLRRQWGEVYIARLRRLVRAAWSDNAIKRGIRCAMDTAFFFELDDAEYHEAAVVSGLLFARSGQDRKLKLLQKTRLRKLGGSLEEFGQALGEGNRLLRWGGQLQLWSDDGALKGLNGRELADDARVVQLFQQRCVKQMWEFAQGEAVGLPLAVLLKELGYPAPPSFGVAPPERPNGPQAWHYLRRRVHE